MSDTAQSAAAAQIEAYRRMGAEARLRVAMELSELGRRLVTQGIRQRHPEYTDVELRLAALRLWLGEDRFAAAYPDAVELAP